MQSKNEILDIIAGFTGALLMLFGRNMFNRYILMSIPLIPRMIVMIITYWLVAIVPAIIAVIRKDRLSKFGFSGEYIGRQVIVGLLTGIAFSFLFTFIPHLAGFGDWVSSGKGYRYLWQFIYEFVYCIFAASLTEEFIFRGFLFSRIERISNSTTAIIVSSVMFGFFHIFSGNIAQVFGTTVLALLFCLCMKKIKSCTLLSLIIAHGIYDALIVIFTYVFNK